MNAAMVSASRFPAVLDTCSVGLRLKSKAPNWRIIVAGSDPSQAVVIIVIVVAAVSSECRVHCEWLREPDAAETQ